MLTEARPSLMDKYVFLVGRPPIGEFMRFARTTEVDGRRADEEELAREWHEARERIAQIETDEVGYADKPGLQPLPPEIAAEADAELETPVMQRALRYVPYRWQLVEIDRLVVFQKFINLRYVEQVEESLPDSLTQQDLLRIAVGKAFAPAPVQAVKTSDNSFCFASSSVDLRFLDVTTIDPAAINGFHASGNACKVIAIYVGFGINLLSAFHVRGRLVLGNGSHRVYALRERGITHVPCLVMDVVRDEQFELVAPAQLRADPERYLSAKRPPLFKDYFDPRLRKIIQTPRVNQVLQLDLSFQKNGIPALA